MSLNIRVLLSSMMFIQYFIWGSWAVTLSTYLSEIGFHGSEIGDAYSTTAIAAMVSPFIVGMIADRFFSTEKVLAVLHCLGAVFMYYASTVTDPTQFFQVMLGYSLCYMPTLALTNSLAFQHMKDPSKEFPSVRVLGTIGWIATTVIIGKLGIEDQATPMKIAAGSSLVMGLFCLALPHTPPPSAGKKVTLTQVLGLDALKMLKDPSFLIFVISSTLICIPLAFYYNFTNLFLNESGMENAAGKMALGQGSEIVFMLVMPFFFRALGVKYMLLVGMVAWAGRYLLFAFGNNEDLVLMYYFGILLHGICYDFFFVTGQIYVDNKAPREIRASAQGFLTLMTLGLGMYIGAKISGGIVQSFEALNEAGDVTGHDWTAVWLRPALMAAVVCVVFLVLFWDKGTGIQEDGETSEEATEGSA